MNKFILIFISVLVIVGSSQVYVEEPTTFYESDEYGFNISMAQQGFGIGGFYYKNISAKNYLGIQGGFYKMRDSKEFEFYYFGYYYVQNKINNLFIFPFQLQYKHLFLPRSFATDLRPNIVLNVGGIFGMNLPNKRNFPQDDPQLAAALKNEYEFGFSWGIGIAVDITTNKKMFFTLKPNYQWVYFKHTIAQQKWHNYYEIRLEFGVRK
jgi:hypothetical protein